MKEQRDKDIVGGWGELGLLGEWLHLCHKLLFSNKLLRKKFTPSVLSIVFLLRSLFLLDNLCHHYQQHFYNIRV